jgi:hypothetical protein
MVIPKFQWTICFALVGVLHQQKTNVTKIVGRLCHTNKGGKNKNNHQLFAISIPTFYLEAKFKQN